MRHSFGTEARPGTGPAFARVRRRLLIWSDWKGELYAFCGRECLRHYQAWVCDPDYLFGKATRTDASFGCIWCGGDLTEGTVWFGQEPRAGSKVSGSI